MAIKIEAQSRLSNQFDSAGKALRVVLLQLFVSTSLIETTFAQEIDANELESADSARHWSESIIRRSDRATGDGLHTIEGHTVSSGSGWVSLFNGKNLDGWYKYLHDAGKDNDPTGVIRVENGMIHILGVPERGNSPAFGYLTTEREFGNCRVRAEFKWGERRFPPRSLDKRDSGLLYYMVGPDKDLPRSLQLQISETDVGDLWINGGIRVTTSVSIGSPPTYEDGIRFRHADEGRIIKLADFEDRNGWNTVEAILDGDRVTHIVNGRAVLRAWNLQQPDPKDPRHMIPLTRGRLQLEVEGAEIWFRNIEVRPLSVSSSGSSHDAPSSSALSLDSPLGELLRNAHSRPILEALLGPDALGSPLADELSDYSARVSIPDLISITDLQLRALDEALRALPTGG